MATPATGAISFADLNTQLLQAGSTAQVSMNSAAQRLGFGATSQVSISELRKAYGATVTCDFFSDFKFVSLWGYFAFFPLGSVDNASIVSSQTLEIAGTAGDGGLNPVSTSFGFVNVASGYEGTNVNIVATANTSRTIDSGPTTSTEVYMTGYNFPSSGTVTIGIRWNI
jgi:hypothetical protein